MEKLPKLPLVSFDLKESVIDVNFDSFIKKNISLNYDEPPDAFSQEIDLLNKCRTDACRLSSSKGCLEALKNYSFQLQSLRSRFPVLNHKEVSDLTFKWKEVHSTSQYECQDPDYEMAAILYNIAAVNTQLALEASRDTDEGLKFCATHFRDAAETFDMIRDKFAHATANDVNGHIANFCSLLCKAQFHQCMLEKCAADNRKSLNTAKVALQVSQLYREARNALDFAVKNGQFPKESVDELYYKEWVSHTEFKVPFYESLSLLCRGIDADIEKRTAERITLFQAADAKLALVEPCLKRILHQDKQIFQKCLVFIADLIHSKIAAVKSENELIYHETPPPLNTLPAFSGMSLFKCSSQNSEERSFTGPEIFYRLIPMKAHEISSDFSAKKDDILRQIKSKVEKKDEELMLFMSSLRMDGQQVVFAMLSGNGTVSPQRLPQDLIDAVAALQSRADNIDRLETNMAKLGTMSQEIGSTLEQVETLIKSEKQYEEEYHTSVSPLLASANMQAGPHSSLTVKYEREVNRLSALWREAADSDHSLGSLVAALLPDLRRLAPVGSQPGTVLKQLSDSLPSPAHLFKGRDVDRAACALRLKELIVKVDEMKSQRASLVSSLQDAIQKDDITGKLGLCAANTDQGQSLINKHLNKHKDSVTVIEQNLLAQDNILRALTEANAAYAVTRQMVEECLKQRNTRVHQLLSCCKQLAQLLEKTDQGIVFYTGLQKSACQLLTRVSSVCKVQSEGRYTRSAANFPGCSNSFDTGMSSSSVPGGTRTPGGAPGVTGTPGVSGIPGGTPGGIPGVNATPGGTPGVSGVPGGIPGVTGTPGGTGASSVGTPGNNRTSHVGIPGGTGAPGSTGTPHVGIPGGTGAPGSTGTPSIGTPGSIPRLADYLAAGYRAGDSLAAYDSAVVDKCDAVPGVRPSPLGSECPSAVPSGGKMPCDGRVRVAAMYQTVSGNPRLTSPAVEPYLQWFGGGGYTNWVSSCATMSSPRPVAMSMSPATVPPSSASPALPLPVPVPSAAALRPPVQPGDQYLPAAVLQHQWLPPHLMAPCYSTAVAGQRAGIHPADQPVLLNSATPNVMTGLFSPRPVSSYAPVSDMHANGAVFANQHAQQTLPGQQYAQSSQQHATPPQQAIFVQQHASLPSTLPHQNTSVYLQNQQRLPQSSGAMSSSQSQSQQTVPFGSQSPQAGGMSMFPYLQQKLNPQSYQQQRPALQHQQQLRSITSGTSQQQAFHQQQNMMGSSQQQQNMMGSSQQQAFHQQQNMMGSSQQQAFSQQQNMMGSSQQQAFHQQQNMMGSSQQQQNMMVPSQQPGVQYPQNPISSSQQQAFSQQQNMMGSSQHQPLQYQQIMMASSQQQGLQYPQNMMSTSQQQQPIQQTMVVSSQHHVIQQQERPSRQVMLSASQQVLPGLQNRPSAVMSQQAFSNTGVLQPQPASNTANSIQAENDVIPASEVIRTENIDGAGVDRAESADVASVLNQDSVERERVEKWRQLLRSDFHTADRGRITALKQDTEDLSVYVRSLLEDTPVLDDAWKRLLDKQELQSSTSTVAVARCYPMKNRQHDSLPFDAALVTVPLVRDDYINACRFPGLLTTDSGAPYRQVSVPPLIGTQLPLASTRVDFWCMVWCQHVELIACLLASHQLAAQDEYWPSDKASILQFGPLDVSLQSYTVRQYDPLIGPGRDGRSGSVPRRSWGVPARYSERIVRVRHRDSGRSRVVILLQPCMPEASSAQDLVQQRSEHLAQFAGQVLCYYRQQVNAMCPVLVHCLTGVGDTGVFCALMASIVRLLCGLKLSVMHVETIVAQLNTARRNSLSGSSGLVLLYQSILKYIVQLLSECGVDLPDGLLPSRPISNTLADLPTDIGPKPPSSVNYDLATQLAALTTSDCDNATVIPSSSTSLVSTSDNWLESSDDLIPPTQIDSAGQLSTNQSSASQLPTNQSSVSHFPTNHSSANPEPTNQNVCSSPYANIAPPTSSIDSDPLNSLDALWSMRK